MHPCPMYNIVSYQTEAVNVSTIEVDSFDFTQSNETHVPSHQTDLKNRLKTEI